MIVSLPLKAQFSLGPLLVTVMALILFALDQPIVDLLAYDRYGIESLESWRWLSSSLVHTNGFHLVLNIAGLTMLWALHGEHYRPLLFIKIFLWCSLGTSIGIYCLSPYLIWYVGLSGTLHGLFVWGACMDLIKGLKSGWILLAGIGAKLTYEQLFGGSPEVAELIGASVAVDAHLYGAVSGLLLFAIMWLFTVLSRQLRNLNRARE